MSTHPDAILAELRTSLLFAEDFPKRSHLSLADWNQLPEDEQDRLDQAGVDAMIRVRTLYEPWETGVHTLGESRHLPAIPLLAELWRDCALSPLRTQVGHALLAMDSLTAYDALEALATDHDWFSRHMAVRAAFRRDPGTAFDRLAPHFTAQDTGAAAIAHATFGLLAPTSYKPDGSVGYSDPGVPVWLAADPRWLALCAERVRDERYGEGARAVLKHTDRKLTVDALDAAQAKRPAAPKPVAKAPGDLLTQYLAGQHLDAWRRARAYPAITGDLRTEIDALANATMTRVAFNIDLLSERLRAAGWLTLDAMRTLPHTDDAALIANLERSSGAPLPPSMTAFWRKVGGVCFVWDYNEEDGPEIAGLDLAYIDTDALHVESVGSIEPYSVELWEDQQADAFHPDLIGPYTLELAPDRLHKMNVSGGPPYGIELPCMGADAVFDGTGLPFVEYLRDCLAWAGFPHLKHHADQTAARRFVDVLGAGLEPF